MSEQTIKDNPQKLEALSDILLVLDKKKNRIEAVKGVDEKGNLQTTEAKKFKLGDFMRIDKGDAVSNFFSNFWRRLNDPLSFRFFKTPEINMAEIAKKLQAAIDNPTPEGNKLLDALEVKYDKNKQMETKQTNTGTAEEEAKPVYKYKVEDIDWSSLEKLNLNRELLEKNGQLDKLLKGYKTDGVYRIEGNFDGVVMKGDARLALRTVNDQVVVMAHGVRKEPDLKSQFYGHTFTPEDRENLLKTGNMGRVAELTNYSDGSQVKALISIDKLTNEVVSFPVELIKMSNTFGGVKLSDAQKAELLEGKQVMVEGMKNSRNDELFSQKLQYSADAKKLVFVGDDKPKQFQGAGIPDEFRGKVLSENDKKQLRDGEVLFLKEIVNKAGTGLYSGYLWYNVEQGRVNFDVRNPMQNNTAGQTNSDPQGNKEAANQQNNSQNETTATNAQSNKKLKVN